MNEQSKFSISDLICTKFKDMSIIDDLGAIKIKYALSVMSHELFNILLLFLFFSYLALPLQFLFCLVLLIPIRTFSGGLHMENPTSCLVVSFSVFYLSIFLLPKLELSNSIYMIILITAILTICFLSPVASSKRPFKTKERYRLCKRLSISNTIVLGCLLFFITDYRNFFMSGVWIIFLQAFQLVIAYFIKKKKDGSVISKPNLQNS